ncbi:MAG: DUF192 domain-containing protein [Pigmentiphaga sp.]
MRPQRTARVAFLAAGATGRWRRRWVAGVLGAMLLAGIAPLALVEAQPQPSLPSIRLTAGLYIIQAEVASTPAQLQQGLMFREQMGPQQGMLFLFPRATEQCMWMANTLLPLSVAFLRDDGTIVNIEDMAPQTRTSHCAAEPVRLALEMNRGWFTERGLEPGHRIRGLPELAPRP